MADRLDGFKKGTISLNRLITDLEALFACLQAVDENWKRAFRSAWAMLEEVYSVAVVRGEDISQPDKQELIDKAVKDIEQLLTTPTAT
jgi:hypothetical protein